MYSILSSEFLISAVVLTETLGVTLPLACKLQAEYMDVLKATQLVEATTKYKVYKKTRQQHRHLQGAIPTVS